MSSIASATKKVTTASQRRKEIIDSAARLFATKGFQNTTVDDIARDCNISKGLVYNYFRSKEDVRDTIVQHMRDAHIEMMHRIESLSQNLPNQDVISAITSVVDLYCHHHSDWPRYTMVVHSELTRLDRDIRRQFVEIGNRCIVAIEKLVAAGVDSGVFVTKHPRVAAVTIMWTALEWVERWIYLRDYYSLDEFIEIHKQNILKMLGVGLIP